MLGSCSSSPGCEPGPVIREFRYEYAAVSPWDGCFDFMTTEKMSTENMALFLAQVSDGASFGGTNTECIGPELFCQPGVFESLEAATIQAELGLTEDGGKQDSNQQLNQLALD